MSSDLYVEHDGHRTWLKWHRARRRAADPVFTGRRILEGMALGASVEVDLVVHGGAGFAVLHDRTLDRETTGTGPVRASHPDRLRALSLRDNTGAPLPDMVMLLEDLAALITRDGAHPDALLQLDYKEDDAALDAEIVRNFETVMAPVAHHFIVSSGDAASVDRLSAGLPRLRIGFDPCHEDIIAQLKVDGNFVRFVAATLAVAPRAELIYLAHPVVTSADDAGFDIIDAFHEAGKRVDAYTINRADEAGIALARRLIALKVDQITTDDPEGLGKALAG
jgi:glycerophosphoryl diester phosphodiesterase